MRSLTARAIAERSGSNACSYCGKETTREHGPDHLLFPTADHIVPLSRGGANAIENMALACKGCNELKGALDGDEFTAWMDGTASRLDHQKGGYWKRGKRYHRERGLDFVDGYPIVPRCRY